MTRRRRSVIRPRSLHAAHFGPRGPRPGRNAPQLRCRPARWLHSLGSWPHLFVSFHVPDKAVERGGYISQMSTTAGGADVLTAGGVDILFSDSWCNTAARLFHFKSWRTVDIPVGIPNRVSP